MLTSVLTRVLTHPCLHGAHLHTLKLTHTHRHTHPHTGPHSSPRTPSHSHARSPRRLTRVWGGHGRAHPAWLGRVRAPRVCPQMRGHVQGLQWSLPQPGRGTETNVPRSFAVSWEQAVTQRSGMGVNVIPCLPRGPRAFSGPLSLPAPSCLSHRDLQAPGSPLDCRCAPGEETPTTCPPHWWVRARAGTSAPTCPQCL